MPRRVAVPIAFVCSFTAAAGAQPSATPPADSGVPAPPPVAVATGVAEPANCTLRTCHLTIESTWGGIVLRRGLPGTRIAHLGWTASDAAAAMASNPEAMAALRGARRANVARWIGGLIAIPAAHALGRSEARDTQLASWVVPVGGIGLALAIGAEQLRLNRLQEAVRIYNAGLPDTSP